MLAIIQFIVEVVFTTDHMVIGSNVILAVVTYKCVPEEHRHTIRKKARHISHVRRARRVHHIKVAATTAKRIVHDA